MQGYFGLLACSPKPLDLRVHTGEYDLQVCSHGSISIALTQRIERRLDASPLLLHRDRDDDIGVPCSSTSRLGGDDKLPRIRVGTVAAFAMHACRMLPRILRGGTDTSVQVVVRLYRAFGNTS